MPQKHCTAQYKRETLIFWEFVHMDGENEYKRMITKIKEIACEFTDDVEKAVYLQYWGPLPRGPASTWRRASR